MKNHEKNGEQTARGKKIRFEKLFENRWFLQLISILIALSCWLFIAINFSNTIDKTFSVPVDMSYQLEALEKLGLKVVGEVNAKAEVKVSGKRYVMAELGVNDIRLTADISRVVNPGVYDLPLQGLNEDLTYENIEPKSIQVKLDVFSSRRFSVEADVTGLSVSEGYIAREQKVVSPSVVNVSGPDELLSSIEQCVLRVNLEEPLSRSTTVEGDILLLDHSGTEIDKTNLRMDAETAKVTVTVLKEKELPLVVKFINLPPNMQEEDIPYTLSSKTIKVAGREELIDRYAELVLGYIDMNTLSPNLEEEEGGSPSTEYIFDVADIDIPSDFLYDENIENVVVTFPMEGIQSRHFDVENIQLLNNTKKYDISVSTKQISNVQVFGKEETLQMMTAGDLVAEVDLSSRDLRPGQYKVAVRIYSPNKSGIWAYGDDYSITINISEKEEE